MTGVYGALVKRMSRKMFGEAGGIPTARHQFGG
jgi:hypothetical protein